MKHALDILVRVLLSGFMFVFFSVGSALLSWVILPLRCAGVADETERVRRCQRTVAVGPRLFHWLMTVFRLFDFRPGQVRAQLPPRPEGAFVMVANHPTLVDVTAIMATYGEMCVVVKKSLFDSLAVGGLLRRCWHIRAAQDIVSGVAVIDQTLQRLEAGLPVLIFPEGTRSPVRGLHRFHRGAFDIARRAGVPIVPLFMTCDPPTLMKGQKWYEDREQTAVMSLTQLEPIAPAADPRQSRTLSRQTQIMYEQRVAGFYARVDGARVPSHPTASDPSVAREPAHGSS